MIKKPILIIVIVFMIAFTGFYYINNFFLPVQFKKIVYETARKSLRREVNFAQIHYRPFKGFVIKDFVIFRKDDPNLPFVHIKEAQFKILFAPLLQRQQIIIPTLLIKNPFVHVIRYPNGQWNFSDLLRAKTSSAQSPFPLLLGRVQITGGQAEITNLQLDPALKIAMKNINADCRLSLSKGIDFQVKSALAAPSSGISLRGQFNPAQKSWQVNVTAANVDALPFIKSFAPLKNIRLTQAGITTADVNLAVTPGQPWQAGGSLTGLLDLGFNNNTVKGNLVLKNADFRYDGKTLNYHGGILLDKAEVSHNNMKIVQGNISLNAKPLAYSLTEEDLVIKGNLQLAPGYLNPSEEISLSFGSAQMKEFHYQQELYTNILTGEISASKVKILAPDLALDTGSLASPIVFSRKGQSLEVTCSPLLQSVSVQSKMKNLSADTLQLKMSRFQVVDRDFSLSTMIESKNLEVAFIDEDDNLHFIGNPQVDLTVQYFPADPQPWVCVGKALLDKGSLSGLPQTGPLNNITGVIEFTRDRMKTSKLSLEAFGTALSLSGSLSNFDNPFIGVVISAKNFNLDLLNTFFKKQLEDWNISPGGKAEVEGSFTGPVSSPKEAQVEINARLEDAQLQSPRWPEPVTGISGILRYKDGTLRWTGLSVTYSQMPFRLTGPFTLNGELSQFERPFIATTILAPDLQATLKMDVDKNTLNIDTFAGVYHQSKFNISGRAFLNDSGPAYVNLKTAFSLNLEDLAQFSPALQEKTA
nr:AsmA family protein [Candidatus Omnitrophota bacterium]